MGFVLLIFGIILISGYALFAFYERGNAIVLALGIVFFAKGVGSPGKKQKNPSRTWHNPNKPRKMITLDR